MITLASLALTAVLSTPCGTYSIAGSRPSFANDKWIRQVLEHACEETQKLGYQRWRRASNTLLSFQDEMPNHITGLWLPQKIMLPSWIRDPEQLLFTLRHEFMHSATQLHCRDYPIWAHEGAAMAFSGELNQRFDTSRLFKAGSDAEAQKHQHLARALVEHPWPDSSCALPDSIAQAIKQGEPIRPAAEAFAYRVIHLASGRVYAEQGSQDQLAPAGSLMKLAWFASLPAAEQTRTDVQDAILRSDSAQLLKKTSSTLNRQRLRSFLGFAGSDSWLLAPENSPDSIAEQLHQAMGEHEVLFSLNQLGLMLRTLFLRADWTSLQFLQKNGVSIGSTLAAAPAEDKTILRQLHALAKTGTNRELDAKGQAQTSWGHLMLAWPAEKPEFLAIFRAPKLRGVEVLQHASPVLKNFLRNYPIDQSLLVKVQLDTRNVPHALDPQLDCPHTLEPLPVDGSLGRHWKFADSPWMFSPCLTMHLLTNTRKQAFPRKKMQGLLVKKDGSWSLLTDLETYTDAVLLAEGSSLSKSAREAFRAIIFTNGGFRREGICASTRCMVFIGQPEKASREVTDRSLRVLAQGLVKEKTEPWLYFSAGGDKPWTRRFSGAALAAALRSPPLLSIERIARRQGEVGIRLLGEQATEEISCDQFHTRLKIPSCPSEVNFDASAQTWILNGQGEGHGRGFLLREAQNQADSGWDAEQILRWAYSPSARETAQRPVKNY